MSRTLSTALISLLVAGNCIGLVHANDDRKDFSTKSALTYASIIRVTKNQGAVGVLAPIVRIVSPINGAAVAGGESAVGAGSPNGTGFAVNLEIVTRDSINVRAREANTPAPGIRHVPELQQGANNPDFPGLYVFFDTDLITPDGTVFPKFHNFASAFNVLGTDDTPGPGVTLWAGWHVLESMPHGVDEMTITVAVVDQAGRIGLDRVKVKVNGSKGSGQALTPAPDTFAGGLGEEHPSGPEVTMIAPRVPTAIAVGPSDSSLNASNGSLFFIQVRWTVCRSWCIVLLLAGSAHSGTDGVQSTIAPPVQAGFVRDMNAAMDRMMRDMHTHGATGNADADFLAMMIPHHEGAVEMARLELLHGKDPLVRHLAEEIIATQNVEIHAMRERYAVINRGRGRDPDGTLVLGSVRGCHT